MSAQVSIENWGWAHAGRSDWAVRDTSFIIEPGERVLLLGASGSGKSTLLHALAGVLGGSDEGEEAGRMLVNGRHPTRLRGHIGLVLQDPESGVVLARVGDDVAFGLENLGVPRDQIWGRVSEALDAVGLRVPLDRSTHELSGGQKQRLAIAGALAMRTPLLLLDEPTANLDPAGVREVHDAIAHVTADRSTTLIIVEHRVDTWMDLVDRVIVLSGSGGLIANGPPRAVFEQHRDALLAAGVWVPGVPVPAFSLPRPGTGAPVLRALNLSVGYAEGNPIRSGLDIDIPDGTSTVVTGPNGSGKTTAALTLAGLLPRLGGTLEVTAALQPTRRNRRSRKAGSLADPTTWRSVDLITRIGTVFQEPEHQFVTNTVREELAVGLRALRWEPAAIRARVDELLALLHLDSLTGANPFTLSGGQKRRLSVGTVLATGPRLIFLDEPTFGQDRNTWLDLVRLVASMLDDGRAIVSVTHDEPFTDVLAQNLIEVGRNSSGTELRR